MHISGIRLLTDSTVRPSQYHSHWAGNPPTSSAASATTLAGAALGADAAGAGADDFVAAAVRADDVHEHVAERFLDAIGVAAAVSDHLRFAVVRRMARDHVEDFFFAGARQVRDRAIDRFLFDLGDFLER